MSRNRSKSDDWSSSEDESDAGSLQDFIASDESEEADEEWAESDGDFVPQSSEDESESNSTCSDADDDVAEATVLPRAVGARRRSGRVSKPPERYIDEDYVRLMTEDVDVEAIFGQTSEDDDDYSSSASEPVASPPHKRTRVHLVTTEAKAGAPALMAIQPSELATGGCNRS